MTSPTAMGVGAESAPRNDQDQVPAVRAREQRKIRRRRFVLGGALALLPFLFLVYTSYVGIDFGEHWDEHLQMRLVARTAKSGVLVPGIYNYPTMCYWLALGPFLPKLVGEFKLVPDLLNDLNTMRSLEQDSAALQSYALTNQAYFLNVRRVFAFVASLVVLWVFFLGRAWGRPIGEAILAAAFVGLSWEYAYHARWIAPDLIMTSFAAVTMALVMGALRPGRHHWIFGAAVATGLATASKYQCGLLLLPLLLAAYKIRRPVAGWRGFLRLTSGLLALVTVTFVLITPAVYLDTGRVIRWLIYVISQYGRGGLGGYDIQAGIPHFSKICIYVGSELFSHFRPFGLLVTLLAFVGVFAMWRASRFQALVFLCIPVIYLPYMATQRIMIVRNDLLVTPFLAIAAARGTGYLWAKLRFRAFRAALVTTVAAGLLANAIWLYNAAWSIRESSPSGIVKEAARYIADHPSGTIFASTSVRWGLANQGLPVVNLARRPDQAKELMFYPDDWAAFWSRPSNIPGLAHTWFGPADVNWNYYMNYPGFQRIVVVSAEKAKAAHLQLNPPAVGPLSP